MVRQGIFPSVRVGLRRMVDVVFLKDLIERTARGEAEPSAQPPRPTPSPETDP
jgi:hypothetical protein